jgi:hypothetical protein
VIQMDRLEKVRFARCHGSVEFRGAAVEVHPVGADDEEHGGELRSRLVLEKPLVIRVGEPVRVRKGLIRGRRNGGGHLVVMRSLVPGIISYRGRASFWNADQKLPM